ncbi:uncharacterized protein LTR77_010592 [Saxophila tyrrhenica]|uniref:MOZ protein represents a chromatin-associated acetyltransferase n=1 Tax=Saxophila tyrrhenica TaxID=1690608 RepID=A0AAV9NYL2_9PEZI|nr:hypothetical protein LTR77_010592 [Saxophila tyrrhenica]
MAASQRIAFLWPTAWRAGNEVYNPALRSARAAAAIRAYHSSRQRKQENVPQQRYGTANEPPPHLGGGKSLGPSTKGDKAEKTEEAQAKALPKIGKKLQQSGEDEARTEELSPRQEKREAKPKQDAAADVKREPATVEGRNASPAMSDPMLDSDESQPKGDPPGAPYAGTSKPLASYLHDTPSPSELEKKETTSHDKDTHAEEHPSKSFDDHAPPVKAPHIEQPRYIHHFDTYGLVRRLISPSESGGGGWNEDQAITVMKAVRLMLADNTDLAKEALVSKSQLENEAYLFKAACAELKTEVTARRKSEQEKMRTERTQLQHEVDILSQRLGQESGVLKDDLKGMFDDRKMAVRNEQRDMERQLQQLNYKITIELQADAKSEIEGLRLVMTRRVILTLGIIILMVIGGLKVMADASRAEEGERKKGKGGGGGGAPMGDAGTQTDGSESVMVDEMGRRAAPGEVVVGREGVNPGFVSLG